MWLLPGKTRATDHMAAWQQGKRQGTWKKGTRNTVHKKKTELNTQALDDQVFWGYTKEWQTYKIIPKKYKMAQSLVPPVWDQQQHVLIAEITGVTLERSRWKWVMLYTIHVEMWLNQKGTINSDKKWALDRISWVELITFPRWRTNPFVGELSITMLSSLIIVSQ